VFNDCHRNRTGVAMNRTEIRGIRERSSVGKGEFLPVGRCRRGTSQANALLALEATTGPVVAWAPTDAVIPSQSTETTAKAIGPR